MPLTELLSSQVPRIQSQKYFTFSLLVRNSETWAKLYDRRGQKVLLEDMELRY
jgi:hypothetical protein